MAGRYCNTCQHPNVAEIDYDLAGINNGTNNTFTSIAEKYGLTHSSVANHYKEHWAKRRKDAATTQRELDRIDELGQLDIDPSDPDSSITLNDLIADLIMSRVVLKEQLVRSTVQEDADMVLKITTSIRATNVALARLVKQQTDCPECPPFPVVSETQEFVDLVMAILAPLSKFPDAHEAVLKALDSVAR